MILFIEVKFHKQSHLKHDYDLKQIRITSKMIASWLFTHRQRKSSPLVVGCSEGVETGKSWVRGNFVPYIKGQEWGTPLILALSQQNQENLSEFEASLSYIMSSRPSKAT